MTLMTHTLEDLVRRGHREFRRLDGIGRDRLRPEIVARADAALAAWCEDGTEPHGEDLARLLVGLRDTVTRDLVSVVEPDQLRVAPAFWTDVALVAPCGLGAAAWCISGLLRWQAGDALGAVADAEMALDDDPGYTMAGYLHAAAGGGLPASGLYDATGTLAERREWMVPDVVKARQSR